MPTEGGVLIHCRHCRLSYVKQRQALQNQVSAASGSAPGVLTETEVPI